MSPPDANVKRFSHSHQGLGAHCAGVPIVTADGEVIGAIGVGGADDVTDDRIAHQGRDSVTKIVA